MPDKRTELDSTPVAWWFAALGHLPALPSKLGDIRASTIIDNYRPAVLWSGHSRPHTVMPDHCPRSREYMLPARQSLAGDVIRLFSAKAPVPLYLVHGSRIREVDGPEYIDCSLAWGPPILRHRHPRLVETLRAQAERPHIPRYAGGRSRIAGPLRACCARTGNQHPARGAILRFHGPLRTGRG